MNCYSPLLLKMTKRLVGLFLDFLSFFDFLTSKVHSDSIPNPDELFPPHKSVGIYVSYRDLCYDAYEEKLFKALKLRGFFTIKIINIDEPVHKVSSPDLIYRKNRAADLGAIRDILNNLQLESCQELIIFNSSLAFLGNIGGFIDLIRQPYKDQITVGPQSFQKLMHFQSYFYYASGVGVSNLKNAFSVVKDFRFKRTLINFGEIRISRRLISSRITLNIPFSYELISGKKLSWFRALGISNNPSLDYAENLIRLGAPFIKRAHPNFKNLSKKGDI
jgi:hypothetical protein